MSSSQHVRRTHRLGSNPWLFLNESYANVLLILSIICVFISDLIIISIHWNVSQCSDILKLWIIGKYFAPLLSYLSCCLFMPCNYEEAIDVTTAIPYSQHTRTLRNLNPLSQIRRHTNPSHPHTLSHINIPYPFDIILSQWCVSPSTITANIAESIEPTHLCCKCYVYAIGIIFDRGILELLWLFIGGMTVVSEDKTCRSNTPILFYYVILQIILGSFITVILILWMVSSSLCPLQVARLMACCYGMECDILGILPQHWFQQLLTMHNHLRQENDGNVRNGKEEFHRNQNYHTLSTIPHTFEQNESEALCEDMCDIDTEECAIVELTASVQNICEMCQHTMNGGLCGKDTVTLECGHQFHSVCIDAWPINLECPKCLNKEDGSDINVTDGSGVDDSDDELDQTLLSSNIQLL